MPLSKEKSDAYLAILKGELLVAVGCTEPIAIAYAASILRKILACAPQKKDPRPAQRKYYQECQECQECDRSCDRRS